MKKQMIAASVAVLALTGVALFAGCSKAPAGQVGGNADEYADKIASFSATPDTVDGTWEQDYLLNVDSDNASFRSFAQNIKATVSFQLDLTPSNPYLYAKKSLLNKDTKETSANEYILAKDIDGTYYYKTNEFLPVKVGTATDAKEYLSKAFKDITLQTAGWIDTSVFTYNKNWVQSYILLNSTNITATGVNFTYNYSDNDSEGVDLTLNAKYVGYMGDSGIVEMGTADGYEGATIALSTNKNGYITSMKEDLSNFIGMQITTPPVPLYLTGTRCLFAKYDAALTYKTLSDVALNVNYAQITSVTKDKGVGSYVVYDFPFPAGEKTPSTKITEGNYIAIDVTPAASFAVDKIMLTLPDGTKEEMMNMSGTYAYLTKVKAGEAYQIEITTKQVAALETATVEIAPLDHGDVKTYDFTLDSLVFDTPTTTITVGHWVAVEIIPDEGWEIGSVTFDGNDNAYIASGYYCWSVNKAGTHTLVVTFKAAE